MNCPVCKRELAPTLSICLTCGAMMNDTVREELQTKVVVTENSGGLASRKLPATLPQAAPPAPAMLDIPRKPATSIAPPKPKIKSETISNPKPAPATFDTSELGNKKTSPTLVEFQSKNQTMPDWRLQLQNAISQRKGGSPTVDNSGDTQGVTFQKQLVTRGANALKPEFVEETSPADVRNPKVAAALKRIEQSRKTFLNEQAEAPGTAQAAPAARNYPFNVVARGEGPSLPAAAPKATVNAAPKPRLVSAMRIEKKGFDTNKLPPLLTSPKVNSGKLEAAAAGQLEELNARLGDEEAFVETSPPVEEVAAAAILPEVEVEEVDDLAPIAMRFNAGFFDLIIGAFGSFVLISPFMLAGGSWISLSGALAFAAAMAAVMFVYLTVSIAFYGRSFGMRLFSLELVDAEENEYPTLHQAAVNSAVFLLSLSVGGLGFLPMFFNDERRAAHDLISGTILIREY